MTGTKQSKERMTIALCVNADGSEKLLLIKTNVQDLLVKFSTLIRYVLITITKP